jgi:hypothetical protein
MPLVGVECCAHVRNQGTVSLERCLECAASRRNGCHYTYELLKLMFDQVQDREDRVSTTTLTSKCLRSEFLKRAEEYTESPDKMFPAFRGTLIHGQLEHARREGSVAEARFHVDIPGLGHLSGSPDLLDVEEGILYDYKTTKENPRFAYPWPDHKDQLNINRWLVDNATRVEWDDQVYEGDDCKQFRPVDWQALVVVYIDSQGPKPLEVTKSEQVPTVSGKGTKSVRVADIWHDDYALAWITERYEQVRDAFIGGELPPIPEAFVGWQHPLCGYCPKKQECVTAYFRDNPVTDSKTYEIRRTA